MPGHRLRNALKTALNGLVDRILGPEETFQPGDVARISRSVVAENNGILLRGTVVGLTGVRDQTGRWQVRIAAVPERDSHAMSRLPFGPGFVLFVEQDCLQKQTGEA